MAINRSHIKEERVAPRAFGAEEYRGVRATQEAPGELGRDGSSYLKNITLLETTQSIKYTFIFSVRRRTLFLVLAVINDVGFQ